ncbi:hypothetical protein PVNG_05976, partial [Plasmodium vivax North Korean]
MYLIDNTLKYNCMTRNLLRHIQNNRLHKRICLNIINIKIYNVVNLCEVLRNEIPEYSQDETTIHDDSCNAINSQYGTYIDFNNKYTCQQVMYILNSISSVPESEHNDDKCKYLYYWTYQRSLQKNINYDVALNLYRSFLNTYFVDHTDPHICKNYMLPTKDIILKRSAKLIELYDIINKNSHQFDCTCAKKCSDLYISYLGECQNDYDYDCCSELQSFKYKYDKKMESIDKCEGGKKILPSAIKHDLHVIIIIPMII